MPSVPNRPKTTAEPLDLVAHHPNCFDWDNPRPIKLAIHNDIVKYHKRTLNLPEGTKKTEREFAHYGILLRVKDALADYCTRPAYLSALVHNAIRIDLHGQPAGIVTEDEAAYASAVLSGKPPPERPPLPTASAILPEDAPLTEENIVSGSLEIVVKFSKLPTAVAVKTGMKIGIRTEKGLVVTTVSPKSWKKLTKAANEYPQWSAVLTGKLGAQANSDAGAVFVLEQPTFQIYEKKPKPTPTTT